MEKKVCPKCGSANIENHRYNPDDHGMCWEDHWICKNCGREGFRPADQKYNQLENIVAPPELCRQIPPTAFSDSAFLWCFDCGLSPFVIKRSAADDYHCPQYPAPTLAEILKAVEDRGDVCPPSVYRDDAPDTYGWCCRVWRRTDEWKNALVEENDPEGPTAAALKLFLRISGAGASASSVPSSGGIKIAVDGDPVIPDPGRISEKCEMCELCGKSGVKLQTTVLEIKFNGTADRTEYRVCADCAEKQRKIAESLFGEPEECK